MKLKSNDQPFEFIWTQTHLSSFIKPSRNDPRFLYKPIIVDHGPALSACTFNSKHLQNFIVLNFDHHVQLVQLNLNQSIHSIKVSLGVEQPKRISHSHPLNALAVLCLRSEVDYQAKLGITASLKIFHDETFQLLYHLPLLPSEHGLSISTLKLGNNRDDKFLIGTGHINPDPNEMESKTGRILLIGGDDDNQTEFEVMDSIQVSGAVGGLGVLSNGIFVACINGFLHAYRIKQGLSNSPLVHHGTPKHESNFELLDTWGSGFLSPTVVTNDIDKILVADDFKSLVLLEFGSDDQLMFTIKCYDYRTDLNLCRFAFVDQQFIASDNQLNLLTLKKNHSNLASRFDLNQNHDDDDDDDDDDADNDDVVEADDHHIYDQDFFEQNLMVDHPTHHTRPLNQNDNPYLGLLGLSQSGYFHLGENVNQFRAGSLIPKSVEMNSNVGQTKLLFVTSTGGIGSIIKLKNTLSKEQIQNFRVIQTYLNQSLSSMENYNHDTCKYKDHNNATLQDLIIDGNYWKRAFGLTLFQTKNYFEEIKKKNHNHNNTIITATTTSSSSNGHHDEILNSIASSSSIDLESDILFDLNSLQNLH